MWFGLEIGAERAIWAVRVRERLSKAPRESDCLQKKMSRATTTTKKKMFRGTFSETLLFLPAYPTGAQGGIMVFVVTWTGYFCPKIMRTVLRRSKSHTHTLLGVIVVLTVR